MQGEIVVLDPVKLDMLIAICSIMGLPITGQHYNLVSLAFYAGMSHLTSATFSPCELQSFFSGFLVWEFPTVYISQKLPVAKYLGKC